VVFLASTITFGKVAVCDVLSNYSNIAHVSAEDSLMTAKALMAINSIF